MTTTPNLVIYSTSVQTANDDLTPQAEAILTARADRLRMITKEDGLFAVHVPIVDPATGAQIGSVTYQR